MGLYSGGLIIGRIFASEISGGYFQEGYFFFLGGGAYYQNFAQKISFLPRLWGLDYVWPHTPKYKLN